VQISTSMDDYLSCCSYNPHLGFLLGIVLISRIVIGDVCEFLFRLLFFLHCVVNYASILIVVVGIVGYGYMMW
jgi:hypothetical protein